jgi:hypothetical protein
MEDTDRVYLALSILALCGAVIMLDRMIGKMADNVRGLEADVSWLKDNTVAHETEARPR